MKHSKTTVEFGDFQTPLKLAQECCAVLKHLRPKTIIEPTCGKGSFLQAAVEQFSNVTHCLGADVNSQHLEIARSVLPETVVLREGDFFATDWPAILDDLPEPILVLGNPPWVTNAELGQLNSGNLPTKTNFQNYTGMEALTGKSNFDISEWILVKFAEWLNGRRAIIAMLCKTAVARKTLHHLWKKERHCIAAIYPIDAARHFDVSVDSCFLVVEFENRSQSARCQVYEAINDSNTRSEFGYRDGRLISNIEKYEKWKYLIGESPYQWRSGIKHDASKVMEVKKEGDFYRNGLGELADLENRYLYPMLKSSDVANGRTSSPVKWMLVTQKTVGENTSSIEKKAPQTWKYLQAHSDKLDKRGSSIYKNRPRFSIFGVGKYTFSPWKIAISGFYKRLAFSKIPPFEDTPVVLDDTTCFLPCHSEEEADYLLSLLHSDPATDFYSSLIFWDAKRPITIAILSLLSLHLLAVEMDSEEEFWSFQSQENTLF